MMQGLQKTQHLVHPSATRICGCIMVLNTRHDYNEQTWQNGQVIHFEHVLSKTLDF